MYPNDLDLRGPKMNVVTLTFFRYIERIQMSVEDSNERKSYDLDKTLLFKQK